MGITPEDSIRGLSFLAGVLVPLGVGVVLGDFSLGSFAAFGAMLAFFLDPHKNVPGRVASTLIGGILLVGIAGLGKTFSQDPPVLYTLIFVCSWIAGLLPPQYAYLGILAKYMASALLLAAFGFPASFALGMAFLGGLIFSLICCLLEIPLLLAIRQKIPDASSSDSAAAELYSVLHGDLNGPLFGLMMPTLVLASLFLAQWLHITEPGWVGLTVLFVMHIDDSAALQRIRQRVVGTMAGVALDYVLVRWFNHPAVLFSAMAVCCFLTPAMQRKSYLYFSLSLTVLVLLIIDLARMPVGGDLSLIHWRAIDTVLACLLVLGGLLVSRLVRMLMAKAHAKP